MKLNVLRGGVIPGHLLKDLGIITPFRERGIEAGLTYGAGPCGYDICLGENTVIHVAGVTLAVSLERFTMPDYLLGVVHDKSTWARSGLLVQNTIIEPGWAGYLTLELTYHKLGLTSFRDFQLQKGTPIAQVVFHALTEPTTQPYTGKYQNQGPTITSAIFDYKEDATYG